MVRYSRFNADGPEDERTLRLAIGVRRSGHGVRSSTGRTDAVAVEGCLAHGALPRIMADMGFVNVLLCLLRCWYPMQSRTRWPVRAGRALWCTTRRCARLAPPSAG